MHTREAGARPNFPRLWETLLRLRFGVRIATVLVWTLGSGVPDSGAADSKRPHTPDEAAAAQVAGRTPQQQAREESDRVARDLASQPNVASTAPRSQAVGHLRCQPGERAIPGRHGMVVSVNAQATEVGVRVLEAGGNAVDAAVAVAFALAVAHPSAGSLGGGGFWLIHMHPDHSWALDFRETAPHAVDRQRFETMILGGGHGPDSVAIPGTVAGLFEAHRRYGSVPWSHLIQGALDLASGGYTLAPGEASSMRRAWGFIGTNPVLRAHLLGENDRLPKAGARIRCPELARTLQTIAESGRNGFYHGRVADSVLEALGPTGFMSARDLAEYQPRWRLPREFNYREYLVRTMPLPSAGGVALTEGLLLLGRQSLERLVWGSTQHLHLLLEIQRRADRDRLLASSDPDRVSWQRLQQWESRYLDPHHWDSHPIDPTRATSNLGGHDLQFWPESDNTTHFSIVDAHRNIVSATLTLSAAFGSKVATRTGIVLNNTLASFGLTGDNQVRPGQRTVSSMAPTLVYDSSGPALVLGSPGGDTIPSTLMQIISNIVDFRMPLTQAVDMPRVHQSYARDVATFEWSRPISTAVKKRLKQLGHRFELRGRKQGDVKCILLSRGALWGYADPREGGLARAARASSQPPTFTKD